MRTLPRLLLVLLFTFGASATTLARPQQPPLPPTDGNTTATAAQLSNQLDQLKQDIADHSKVTDAMLVDARTRALKVVQQTDQIAVGLQPQEDGLQAKLDVLGAAPEKGAPAEDPEVAAKRKQLNKDKADVDSRIKQAQSLSLEGQQLVNEISSLRRELFQDQLTKRTDSPLSLGFWSSLGDNLSDDAHNLVAQGAELARAVQQAWQQHRLPFVSLMVLALALLFNGRRLLEKGLLEWSSRNLPTGHLRRSALAVLIVLITGLTYGVTAWLMYHALDWGGSLDQDMHDLLHPLIFIAFFASGLSGLGRALLSAKRPSWRVTPLSDALALRLRPYPATLAYVTVLLGVIRLVSNSIGASVALTVAANALSSTLVALTIGTALVNANRVRQTQAQTSGGHEHTAKRPLWIGLVMAAATLGVLVILASVLSGYLALAFFLATRMLRGIFIIAALYLLMHLINDLAEDLISPDSKTGKRIHDTFGVSGPHLEQAAVVLSGGLRAFLFLAAMMWMFFSPYEAGPADLASRGAELLSGQSLGSLAIRPGNILKALLVLVVGIGVIRMVKNWLSRQLLPRTSLDVGMQTSITTLLSYVFGVLVMVLVLGALEVDVQSIAWVASALSVGIGFGLQAIVQNFISGLILLAERPVKVGDWITLGDVEGDIRRINVRATEIQLNDRSTVIVPNSQLITQNVRNVTLANAQGRVRIKLPMPLSTDAARLRQLVLEVLRNHNTTLATPTPSVILDSVDAGSMVFLCTAYVSNPRDITSVKSDLLFEIIESLRNAGLPLTTPQDMVVRTMPPEGGSSSKS